MSRGTPPPLPDSNARLVIIASAVTVCVLFALLLLFVWTSADPGHGENSGNGDAQVEARGQDASSAAGPGNGSPVDTGDRGAAAGSSGDAEISPDAPADESNEGLTSHADSLVGASNAVAPLEIEAENIRSSPAVPTYEFFTRRNSIAPRLKADSHAGRQADFFGVAVAGRQFVYVVDKSSSMTGERFELAREELLSSIKKLKRNQSFFVIFYDDRAYPQPSKNLTTASYSTVRRMSAWIKLAQTKGGTWPMTAIEQAMDFKPDAVFILSDGEFDLSVVEQTKLLNDQGLVTIHTIGFQNDAETLKAIARQNGGVYRFVP